MDDVTAQIADLLNEGMGNDEGHQAGAADDVNEAPENTETDDADVTSVLDQAHADHEPVEGPDEAGQAGDTEDDQEEPEPVTVKALAERLGVEAKDLYDDLVIPLGDDESVTLGEFKDRVKELRDLDGQREEFTEKQSKASKEALSLRAEMQTLMNILPDHMRSELIQASSERHTQYRQEQGRLLREAIPEWEDAVTREADRDSIVSMSNEYGFSEQEILAASDHRVVRMLNDFQRLRKQLETAKTELREKKAKKASPGRPASTRGKRQSKLQQVVNKAKASGDRDSAVGAISQLIRSQ